MAPMAPTKPLLVMRLSVVFSIALSLLLFRSPPRTASSCPGVKAAAVSSRWVPAVAFATMNPSFGHCFTWRYGTGVPIEVWLPRAIDDEAGLRLQ